jgi:glycosyltransferase involved in cell wall biosynthesis
MTDTPIVSVITPHRLGLKRSRYLSEVKESLLHQKNGPIEWLVCIDGGTQEQIEDEIPLSLQEGTTHLSVKVLHTYGRLSGASATRNYALTHAKGDYISSVDDDDILPANVFVNRLELLETHPDLHWAGGWLQDIDGQKNGVWYPPATARVYAAGEIFEQWEAPSSEFPMNTAGLLMRKQSLQAVGGWQGLPTAEDFGLIMGLTGAYPGVIVDEVIYLYRKHAEQTMQSSGFQEIEQHVRQAVWDRAAALTK